MGRLEHMSSVLSRSFEAVGEEAVRQTGGSMKVKTISRRNWPEGNPLWNQQRVTSCEPFEEQNCTKAVESFVLARVEITGTPIIG